VIEEGFNGKLTEVHAALGLANLKYYDEVLEDRKRKYFLYKEALSGISELSFQALKIGEPNYSYFPLIFESEEQMFRVTEALSNHKIYPRRYFYPSVNTYTKIVEPVEMPISEDISKRILCLPHYWKLTRESIGEITKIVKESIL